MVLAVVDSSLDAVRDALRENPDGVLETVADANGVSYRTVLDCLPCESATKATVGDFDRIWQDLTTWGPVVFIVHTADGVFETACTIPPGTHARGYFNIHRDPAPAGPIFDAAGPGAEESRCSRCSCRRPT